MYGMRTVDALVPRGGVPPALLITIGASACAAKELRAERAISSTLTRARWYSPLRSMWFNISAQATSKDAQGYPSELWKKIAPGSRWAVL